ncbi:MAG: glutathione S-transferase [Pseudomonadota bacterium]|jgi:glutathione S-transferase|nr:glutathione S-transferase [Pseudomonadota bacterium]
MQLIGMLDSPFVRRTAISLQMLGLPFEHRSLSVFRDYDEFRRINPLVKAPTLICDDGTQLIDSSLIIDYAESTVAANRRLLPVETAPRRDALRWIGLALLAAEKAVQIVYERKRPDNFLYQPWLQRVGEQLRSAGVALEREVGDLPAGWLQGEKPGQADITVAVAWGFIQLVVPEIMVAADYPTLTAFSARAEQLPAFQAWPLPSE